jgi:acyl-CoA thioesterase-1
MRSWWMGGVIGAALACGGQDDSAPNGAAEATPQVSESAPLGATQTGRARVVILGTSLTAGLGVEPQEAYPAVLQQLADSAGFPVEIVNSGLSGETSAGALRRVDWLLQAPPALLIIETGANDGLRGLDPDTTAANIRGIVASVRARYPDTPIALVQMEAPPNMGPGYTDRFRAIFPAVARELGVTLLPFLLLEVAGRPELNQSDGIHPSPAGAALAARTLWPALVPLLRDLVPPTS